MIFKENKENSKIEYNLDIYKCRFVLILIKEKY